MDKRKSGSKEGKEKTRRIISLEDYRKNKYEEKKREYERVLFNRILGVYSFAEKDSLKHVEVIDISYSGLKFKEDKPSPPFLIGDKVALRFYFTPSTFLRAIAEVRRSKPFSDDGKNGIEYGCEIDKKTKSYEVIKRLVSFMYKYSEIACLDQHPPLIWF